MIPCYLIAASRDPDLTPREFRVLVSLHADLSPRAYLPVKRAALANQVGLSGRVVVHALRGLVQRGYLLRGPLTGDPGRQIPSYRLLPPTETPDTKRSPLRSAG